MIFGVQPEIPLIRFAEVLRKQNVPQTSNKALNISKVPVHLSVTGHEKSLAILRPSCFIAREWPL